MSEDEIKAALSIEIEQRFDMCSGWIEVNLLWNGEVISTSTLENDSSED